MRKQTASESKRFSVYYRKGWIYLEITDSTDKSSEIYPDEIQNRMRLLGMPRIDTQKLGTLISEAKSQAVRIIEWPEGEALCSEIEVIIDKNEMQADLIIHPPQKGAADPSFEDIEAALMNSGVSHGLEIDSIRRACLDRFYNQKFTAARGTQAIFGSGHRIIYHFSTDRGKPYKKMDFGRIDLKELNFIEMVHAGDILAELSPPVQAVDGSTVTGKRIPAETDDEIVMLRAGDFCSVNDEKTHIIAENDGNVLLRDGAVCVEPVITVKNVDYSTGNIHFEGSILIEGYVADGFEVNADGDIQISKGVGRASLRAGRNVVLQSGMNGNGNGSIDCGGDLYAKYLESCEIRANGNLFLEEAILHSNIIVRGHCLLNGRRAEIIGGELIVGGSCWCRKLGNINEQASNVSIGTSPDVVHEYRLLRTRFELQSALLDQQQVKLSQVEKALAEGISNEKLLIAQTQLTEHTSELQQEIQQLHIRLPELKEKLEAQKNCMLVVEDNIFPGVTVCFGRHEYRTPDTGARKTILEFKGDRIIESGFDARNKPRLFPG
ncbi:DUF342 domain-containing protein [Spirochaeta dissipatitropha]